MADELGAREAATLLAALQRAPLTGLRVRAEDGPVAALLERCGWAGTTLPWSPEGALLAAPEPASGRHPAPGRHPASLHPWQDAGAYYLQDPSAMGVVPILDPRPGDRVLDLAAAPGGKSTYIADRLRGEGLLWSHDVDSRRVDALIGNLERWGVGNAVVSQGPVDVLGPLRGYFDKVLLDAPCSGEGLFRKSADARRLWSAARVAEFASLQARLLDFAVELLRPGGVLVYATCTFETAENEGQMAALLARRPDLRPEALDVPGAEHGLSVAGGQPGLELACARWWPQRQTGEGHFAARLRRDTETASPATDEPARGRAPGTAARQRQGRKAKDRGYGEPVPSAELAAYQAFVDEALGGAAPGASSHEGASLRSHRGQLWLVPERAELHGLAPRRVGAPLGTSLRGRFEPHHAFARLLPSHGDHARHLDLTCGDPDLHAYLRGETIAAAVPDGWLLVRAEGLPLGWAKAKRGELNNHYPRGLRHRWG